MKYIMGIEHPMKKNLSKELEIIKEYSKKGEILMLEAHPTVIQMFHTRDEKIPTKSLRKARRLIYETDFSSYWFNLMRRVEKLDLDLKFVSMEDPELLEEWWASFMPGKEWRGSLIKREKYFGERIRVFEEFGISGIIAGAFHLGYFKHNFPEYKVLLDENNGRSTRNSSDFDYWRRQNGI